MTIMTNNVRKTRVRLLGWALVLGVVCLLVLSACAGSGADAAQDPPLQEEPDLVQLQEPPEPEEPADPREAVDLSLKPNEAGQIMVLMYHNIGEPEAEWVRTPENFRRDLEVLYEQGYRPIRLTDFVKGHITTQAGYTPVVITFDDANLNNFNVLEDGSVDPDSAFGILKAFGRDHPDFPLHVTFFADGSNPFRQPDLLEWKIEQLLEAGMDIGNHTEGHQNMTHSTAQEVQFYIGAQVRFLESLVADPDYRVNTLALTYGIRPRDESLHRYLEEGEYDGFSYRNVAVLNVGWHPAHSPYDDRFDPMSIPRIRASEMKVDNVGMYNYLEYFDNNPGQRFVSDGQPGVITVPGEMADRIEGYDGDRLVYIYDQEADQ